MTESKPWIENGAYIVIQHEIENISPYIYQLSGQKELYKSVKPGEWVLLTNKALQAISVGRVYCQRSTLDSTTIFFDKHFMADAPIPLSSAELRPPKSGHMSRLEWIGFVEALPKLFHKTIAEIPLIEDDVYVRDLLQNAVMDDLLGPANGPSEQILDMSVRDRYLLGRLAPLDSTDKSGGFGIDGSSDDDEAPDDLVVKAQAVKPDTPTNNASPDPESNEEVDAASNQSLIPSSMGMTFCVAGDVDQIEVEALWGCYERFYDHEMYKTTKNPETGEEKRGQKVKVWQRIPCGKTVLLPLTTGVINPLSPDKEQPNVVVQGTVREPNENGDRLVTLFLVNTQVEPPSNRDTAWLFQPEIIVRSLSDGDPIFRRRPVMSTNESDWERASLEMIYRKQVEFAVGHGVAVHASVDSANVELATTIKTVIMPEYEVPITEVPGLRSEDRTALKTMVNDGYLDMTRLAAMTRNELVSALTLMTDDYAIWIAEQLARVGVDVNGHDDSAKRAMASCKEINLRLQEGIAVLADESNEEALKAFRFANQAMAKQRVQSIYALKLRQGKKIKLDELWSDPKNYSWRSFQLAFLLLSIPALANPKHPDRISPAEAFADLLWFPTGGGKTEAYLGVAAFTMSIRRFQGSLGGYDSSRGLAVIMRYTLRLLTLQQFQRATALICAMEVIRRDAIAKGDVSLGEQPFTIGLWVGNKVSPGTTDASHQSIKDIRNPDKFNAGSSSPAQLTSCPWCGTEIDPSKHIEVNTHKLQTSIYCGDKKGRCDFSKAKTAKFAHPGLPVLVVDEEIYHRPPSMMIATVDKFAMMAWRGQTRTLFGKASLECERHGLLWPDGDCTGNHPKTPTLAATKAKVIKPIRPPDLIIQDEFHLISGPLGTMVGLYETAIDELTTWDLDGISVKPKIIASTATVRKAKEQVSGVFNRKVAIFPPHGLDIEDNFFSVQRPIEQQYGRRYLGVCSPGSARPAVLIRVYTAFLTASQALFDQFGRVADPYMTSVGYFNSLRELGGMKRLAEDDVQTRSYRVQMSLVDRPGLSQRSVNNIKELTSRVSSQDIPKYLDQLEVPFRAEFDDEKQKFVTKWKEGESRAIDVVLATNMLSVGVDVNRLGVMAVNGQPKSTAEYIQATSRVGRSFPGLVCTVLTWARPRDLSHYETFEHYHATFYKHVEAQSVTPFSPRAMDRGLTGAMLSLMRLNNDELNPNDGASALKSTTDPIVNEITKLITDRVSMVAESAEAQQLAEASIKQRIDEWVKENAVAGRTVAYEKRGKKIDSKVRLIKSPGVEEWDRFTVPMSMREVEPGVKLQMNTNMLDAGPNWKAQIVKNKEAEDE
ncbi:DISARM system helicase DrmA [Leucothrix arctica]|uniref:Helicase n=1 Tax=Leucothrix arctica TaxID=1481894 RepID=A0A317C5C4_9GAMM|nr:DISARM system helicase DrmA [Leucothrix arctica]PWQ93497.1 helicase [Leucothrix arctica]